MKHVVVIGAGFAGAAAASALAEAGVTVTVLEQKAVLGGRTSSLRDGVTGEDIDNGQHLFLGGYTDTRQFLRRLKVEQKIRFLPSLDVRFRSPAGRAARLRCPPLPASLGLVKGLLGFEALSVRDRVSLMRGLLKLKKKSAPGLAELTVTQWLDRHRQPAAARRAFWTPLCLATLNESPDVACAEALAVVLRDMFFKGARNAALGYSTVSLGKLWPVEFISYVRERGGTVAPRQSVIAIQAEGRRVLRIVLQSGQTGEPDAVISAVPLPAFLKICPAEIRYDYEELQSVEYSSILSVNLWFPRDAVEDDFAGLLDTRFHWVFNRRRLWENSGTAPGYLSLVMSGANSPDALDKSRVDVTALPQEKITALALADLRACYPGLAGAEPVHSNVVWEKQATPSPSPYAWKRRPPVETGLENFFIAGDWVDTGLPATIEAASRSGHRAAAAVLKRL
jgi:squalene-associated FAD-dependent desaturase